MTSGSAVVREIVPGAEHASWDPDVLYRSALVFGLPDDIADWICRLRNRVSPGGSGDGIFPHLTLLYLGVSEGDRLSQATHWLSTFPWSPVRATLEGLGTFGTPEEVRTLYASVRRNDALVSLHRRVLRKILRRPWFRLQTEFVGDRYTPHITIRDGLARRRAELRMPPFDPPSAHFDLRGPKLMVTRAGPAAAAGSR